MPHISNTPEAILPRSDSRNPATTCRGITVTGQPCRRSVAASIRSRAPTTPAEHSDGTEFYCWQHKNQSQRPTSSFVVEPTLKTVRPAKRTSIDTLIERLEGLEVEQGKRVEIKEIEPKRRPPPNIKKDIPRNHASHGKPKPANSRQRLHSQQTTYCCFQIVETENLPAARPVRNPAVNSNRQRKNPSVVSYIPSSIPSRPHGLQVPVERVPQRAQAPITPVRQPPSTPPQSSRQSVSQYSTPTRPSLRSTPASSASQTRSLLALIPLYLSPQTTALLLSELAKPISEADKQGYIYIFWATPSSSPSTPPPPPEIASALLPSSSRPGQDSQMSNAIRAAQSRYAVKSGLGTNPGIIRLKIGRASNVHRRLNEWTRQCSHNLTLIRYYPYSSSSPSSSPAGTPGFDSPSARGRKVPHVHRVERLIHIELANRRVQGEGPCNECGKEHREWFELEARKEELRLVDECVRRWVDWAEKQG